MREANVLDDLAFDYAFIANQITSWRKRHDKSTAPTDSLTNAITEVMVADSIIGSSTLEIAIADPEAAFLHYFDVDENGRLDAIDINYPAENENAWWRMTQMSLSCHAGHALEYRLVFLERPAVYLMGRRGSAKDKRSRNAVTRAEFIKSLVGKVQGGGGINFICNELSRSQVTGTRQVSTAGGGGTKLIWAGDTLAVGTWSLLKKHKGYADTLHETASGRTSAQTLSALTPRLNDQINQVVFDAGSADGTTTGFAARLASLYAATGTRDLILLTVHGVSYADAMNTIITDFAGANSYVYVADWNALATDHPEYLRADGINPNHKGYGKRADLIWGTIDSIPGVSLRVPIGDDGPVVFEPGPDGLRETEDTNPKKAENKRRARKGQGISQEEGAELTIDGIKARPEQIRLANIILDTADKANAGQLATEAIMVAAMGESQIQEIMQGYPSSKTNGAGGVFQGSVSRPDMPHYFKLHGDTDKQAYSFLMGGKGFGAGGAKSLSKRHPNYTPGNIAGLVEVSGKNYPGTSDRHYDKYLTEARAFIDAYGGGFDHGQTVIRGQYNFLVPKGQTYWDAIQDMADEVNWRFFVDSRTCFFDSDMTLIRQIPAAYIRRRDPSVVSWQAHWDGRRIATQMTLELICEPFEFRAGEVLVLRDFGIVSEGSTAKLPGRWLITDVERRSGQVFSSLTLAQPEHAKPEPSAPTIIRSEDDNDEATEVSKGSALDQIQSDWTPANVINRIVLPMIRDAHVSKGKNPIGPKTIEELLVKNKGHTHLGDASDHAGWKQNGQNKLAIDIGQGYESPTGDLDALARELLKAFDMGDLGDWNATSGAAAGNLVTENDHKYFRYQLIWRYDDPNAGNHYNHIHFGVRKK